MVRTELARLRVVVVGLERVALPSDEPDLGGCEPLILISTRMALPGPDESALQEVKANDAYSHKSRLLDRVTPSTEVYRMALSRDLRIKSAYTDISDYAH